MVRAPVLTLLLVVGVGCGGNDEPPPDVTPPGGCAAGEWPREDGSCVPAGLPPDMPCPPAEWLRDDGECIPAGVPPDDCGEGFVHDGDRGCEPVLPDEPCPPGLIAVPGETVCREVAPCAPGEWGDIPVETDTEYVDASYAGMDSDGSALKPWTSIQAAVDAAATSAIVAIAAGSYLEDVTVIGKPVRLWGVCPGLVEVVGSGASVAAVTVVGASGSEVRGIAVSGAAVGFGLSGSVDILIERVWVHESAGNGIAVENSIGPTRVILREALVEQNHGHGVLVSGSELTIEASVVRATQRDAEGSFGRGVGAQADFAVGTPSTLLLQRSLVEQNHDAGVLVAGAEATLEASVVRTTQPDVQGLYGRGVGVQPHPLVEVSTLLLQRSLVEQNHELGVFVQGSTGTLEASVVRATQPTARGLDGRGVSVQTHPTTVAPGTLLIERSLVDQNHDAGVLVWGSEATLDASVVRATQPEANGLSGHGVGALAAEETTVAPATLIVRHSLVEQNHELGVLVSGSQGTLEASVVRATQRAANGHGGRGVAAQPHAGVVSALYLERSLIEENYEAGVYVVGSFATMASCFVRDTLADADGVGGHAIAVVSELGSASATITATRVDESALAAVVAFGAHVAIGGSELRCNGFDLDAEIYEEQAASLDDQGFNVCGCPEASAPCKAVSANLLPPSALEAPMRP